MSEENSRANRNDSDKPPLATVRHREKEAARRESHALQKIHAFMENPSIYLETQGSLT